MKDEEMELQIIQKSNFRNYYECELEKRCVVLQDRKIVRVIWIS